ncbi:MAG: hypothetical protein JWM11_1409 [Planctomycetaceae bacterium]|nr:hypothetical protein [Planctomycetaceae bacterium]
MGRDLYHARLRIRRLVAGINIEQDSFVAANSINRYDSVIGVANQVRQFRRKVFVIRILGG